MAERLTVAQEVAGSTPVTHPITSEFTSLRVAICTATFMGLIASTLWAQHSTRPAAYPTMAEVVAEFRRSPVPRRADLHGDWVNTTVVNTERFLTGRLGADHIFADSNGFTRDNGKLDWIMSIGVEKGRVVFVSTTQWSDVEHSVVAFDAAGEARFSKDYGGDTAYRYRCRMPTSRRLVCILDREPPGHAIEFRRVR